MKENRKQLIRSFKKLNKPERQILEILSILYEGVTYKTLEDCIKKARIKDTLGLQIRTGKIDILVRKMKSLSLITGHQNKFKCNREINELVMKTASRETYFNKFIKAVQAVVPITPFVFWRNNTHMDRFLREVRIGFYTHDIPHINQYVQAGERLFGYEFDVGGMLMKMYNDPFDGTWLLSFPEDIQRHVVYSIFVNTSYELDAFDLQAQFIKAHKTDYKKREETFYRSLLVHHLIHQGNWEAALDICKKDLQISLVMGTKSMIYFLLGKNEEAIKGYEIALKAYRKESSKRKTFLPYFNAPYFILALFKAKKEGHLKTINQYLDYQTIEDIYRIPLLAVAKAEENNMKAVRDLLSIPENDGAMSVFFRNLAMYWIYREDADFETELLEKKLKKAQQWGYKWLEMEYAALLTAARKAEGKSTTEYEKIFEAAQKATGYESMMELIERIDPWERALQALINIGSSNKRTPSVTVENRIAWFVDFKKMIIQPKEQRIGKSGKWTKGRAISYERLSQGDIDCMLKQDHQLVSAISYYSKKGKGTYELNDKMVLALVGHPYLFLYNSTQTAVELVKIEPELIIQQKGGKYQVRFSEPVTKEGVTVVKETPTRYKAVVVAKEHLQIVEAIGAKTLTIPPEAAEKLSKAVESLSNVVNVQSEIGQAAKDIPSVESNAMIHVHLLPVGDGFQLELFVRPFGEFPPYFKPATGGTNVIADINGQRVQTKRKMKAEKANALKVLQACPALSETRNFKRIWTFDSPEDCLEVLAQLQELNDEIIVEWPKGEKLKIAYKASGGQFAASVKKDNNWFGLSGTLNLDKDLVLNMKDLLAKVEQSKSRFIELDEGKYLALTERFQKQLKDLMAYGDETKNGMRFHPLAALNFQDLAEDLVEFEADQAWKEQVTRIEKAQKIRPRVPSTFKATLRPYQKEGYKWLSQLAAWGVGGCLADDMGLGKTVQALALVLSRAKQGPTLVAAPSSVRINWEREALRFAPTLNPLQFGKGDRKEMLTNLKPFDLMITSYGLLQQEGELFETVEWTTIILDEAQAIKNRNSKRSKAAMKLKGDFRLITTGTPIENHLGELWNLFRFINPGLLGSLSRFQNRFSNPIERHQDENKRESLQKLIRPFILRRRKNDVLRELPPKTEISLTVELSKEERAFYEALRSRAMDKLDLAKLQSSGGGKQHLQILAEIMKLRRACCNPKLVVKSSKIESSKLKVFGQLVEELIENGHKALVFSQFVGHLAILEKHLRSKKIAYQYLDGSTSQKKRQERIDAFQGGEGDIFLISLKAGGVGLNLTAADYVIHMDPWWNPAVEDQASDRAHRIGQKRPVTIYRLVTKDTIEEKIVNLHHQKRDLADSLLAGSNESSKLSAGELIALIKGNS